MWRIIFIIMVSYYVLIFGVLTRPVEEPKEGLLWSKEIARSIDYYEDDSQDKYRRIPTSNNKDYYVVLLPKQQARPADAFEKRAMSMFARWTPISNLGLNRSPIRVPIPDSGEKTQARRMYGQPLRWG